jgi:putative heme-binding domain-containing protein
MHCCRLSAVVLLILPAALGSVLAWHASNVAQERSDAAPVIRQPWTSSRITGSPEPPPPYKIERAFPALTFSRPIAMAPAGGSNRLFVIEHNSKIFSFPNDPAVDRADLFTDLKAEFKQLSKPKEVSDVYGLAFHPKFAENRTCFIAYTLAAKEKETLADGARVSRFKVTDSEPPRCDPASEEVLITWLGGGHMGSCLCFGPDGMLYISTGDAASPNPPDLLNTGQDLDDLLSCILRIDVDRRDDGRAYAIPPDNPFISTPGARGEIWAFGFRNPWKMSFDRAEGDLWAADVGWELWEMVHHIERGGNYGWSIMEGPQPVRGDLPAGPGAILPPADALPHSISASITGGHVYRGKRLPELEGHYIYGDWETRRLWGAKVIKSRDENGQTVTRLGPRRDLTDPTVRVGSFGEDNEGEVYLLDYDLGTIHRIVPNEVRDNSATFPRKLSETGLFSDVVKREPASGVYRFDVNAEHWCDHVKSERLVGVPGEESIVYHPRPVEVPGSMFTRVMNFPKDAAFVRTLSLDMKHGDQATRRPIETQVLHFDGREFRAYSYAWNDDATDADLVAAEGTEKRIVIDDPAAPGGKRLQTWVFASRTQCLQCHNPWSNHTLAFNTLQLNREQSHGEGTINQLDLLRALKLLVPAEQGDGLSPKSRKNQSLPKPLVDPYDTKQDLADRARSYLHVNCSHCHRFGGGGNANFELKYEAALERHVFGARPTLGGFGIQDAAVVAPGDPYHSVMYYRLAKTGRGHMPHLGSELIDEHGLHLIHDWIAQLPGKTVADADGDLKLLLKQIEQPGEGDNVLSSTPRALFLAHVVADGQLGESARQAVVAAGTAHRDPVIRDLFERFSPQAARGDRLGNRIKPEAILSLTGDAERGRRLFLESTTLQCKTCHRVGELGGSVGPELAQAAKRLTREQIVENLLEPSKTVALEYRTHTIELHDGRTLTGVVAVKNDRELVLRDAEAKEHRLPVDEIERDLPVTQSLMPEGLLRDLTAQEAADLVEYLCSLK